MRAVGHALVAVLGLAGHVHRAPPRAGGQDHGTGEEGGAAVQFDLDEAALGGRRHELRGSLQVHDVDVVLTDVILERGAELGTFGVGHGDEVLDRHRVEHLAAEALGSESGANSLAGGVDRGCGAGRSAADDEYVERVLLGDRGGRAVCGAGVELADDLLEAHAARVEQFPVEIHRRYGHHLASVDLVLEQGAVDGDVRDARIEHAHQVQGLHDVRAVLAGEREVGLEVQFAVQVADLLLQFLRLLRRVTADLEESECEGGELVTERDAGEADLDIGADPVDGERGASCVVVAALVGDLVRHRRDLVEKGGEFGGLGSVVEGGHELDRQGQPLEEGLQLAGERGFEHGYLLHRRVGNGDRNSARRRVARRSGSAGPDVGRAPRRRKVGSGGVRSCRRGPATGRGSRRPLPTWPGRPRPGATGRTERP